LALDVDGFNNESCKILNHNSKQLLRKQRKTLGGYFFAAPCRAFIVGQIRSTLASLLCVYHPIGKL